MATSIQNVNKKAFVKSFKRLYQNLMNLDRRKISNCPTVSCKTMVLKKKNKLWVINTVKIGDYN